MPLPFSSRTSSSDKRAGITADVGLRQKEGPTHNPCSGGEWAAPQKRVMQTSGKQISSKGEDPRRNKGNNKKEKEDCQSINQFLFEQRWITSNVAKLSQYRYRYIYIDGCTQIVTSG